MKRLSLYLFLVLFALPTPSQADNIRDFQIEGISVGDSLLDYFSKEEIDAVGLPYYYKDKKFAALIFENVSFFKDYKIIQVTYKPSEKEYKLHSVEGKIEYPNNISGCLKKMDEIEDKLSKFYKDIAKKNNRTSWNHRADKHGESKITSFNFKLYSGGGTQVECTDWSNRMTKEKGWIDELRVTIDSQEFTDFLIYEAYK